MFLKVTNNIPLGNGLFLDTLLERKVKESDVHPKDMLMGDRVSILIFLRSTGYGHMYPIRAFDPEKEELFETEIDLTTLKIKKLSVKPDRD